MQFMRSKLSLALSVCVGLAGCAATPEDPDRARAPACDQSANCFFERNIRSFRVLDNRTVVVLVGRDQCPFKLELDGIFCNVNMAAYLAFDNRNGRICRFDRTLVATGPFARPDEYCQVSALTPMTDDELLEAYALSGLTAPLPAKGSGELEVEETSSGDAPQAPSPPSE